jgi:hypothetical protein
LQQLQRSSSLARLSVTAANQLLSSTKRKPLPPRSYG